MSRRKSAKNDGAYHSVADSLQEYGRGVAGGLMFSLPLLYTMEVWRAGFNTHPWRLAAYVLATFILLLGYNRFAGFHHDARLVEVVTSSVEEMGIGFIIAAVALYLLGRVTPEMPLNEIAGQIVIEAMTVAIGVSVGTAQLGGASGDSAASATTMRPQKGRSAAARRARRAAESAAKRSCTSADRCCWPSAARCCSPPTSRRRKRSS